MIPGFVHQAINNEIEYQDAKFGAAKEQSLPGYLLIMKKELEEAEHAWLKGPWNGRNSAMAELLQVVTVGIRALTQYGVDGCPRATNDVYTDSKPYKSAAEEAQCFTRDNFDNMAVEQRFHTNGISDVKITNSVAKL